MSEHSSDTSLRFIPQSDKCPRCCVVFDYIKRAGNNLSKLPLILPCNHVLCEDCLYKLAVKENNKCPICQHPFKIPKTHWNRLCEIFVPHYALIGYLLLTKHSVPKCNFDMIPSGRTIRDRQNGKPSNSNQSDELLSEIEYDDNLVVEDVNYLKFKKCTEHFDKDNDIYCKTCNLTICSYCFVENHIDHTPIHLYKLTNDEQVVLKDSIAYLKTVLNSLYQSLKKLDQIQTADYTDIKKEIKKYFTDYHGKLHLIEKQLLDQLNNCNNIGNYNNEDEKIVIQQTIHRILHTLTIYKTLKTTKSINIKALLKEVQTLKHAPCQLVLQQQQQQQNSGDNAQFVQFIADQDLDNLERKFQISQPNCVNYHLIPYEYDDDKLSTITSLLSLPSQVSQSNYDVNDRLTVNYDDIHCLQSNSSRSSSSLQSFKKEPVISDDNLIENMSEDSITAEIQSLHVNKPTDNRIKDKLREVIVTHLNDFDSFYVQTIQSQSNLKDLSKQLRNLHKKSVTPDKLVINNLYLVCYNIKGNNYWRRGRLIRIVDNKDAGKSCEIFYIDYGNKQLVTLDKLYLLHNRISRHPFAFHCKLKRPSTLIWNEEVRLFFIQIVKNKELLLKRCNKQHQQSSGLAEDVELFVRDSNHSLMQIVDLLLKNNPSCSFDRKILKNPLKLFKNTTNFVKGQQEFVNITTINDPYNIYVQLVRNIKYLDELRRNMDNYFIKNQRYSCIPAENSDVIVNHKGNWYRADVQTVCLPEKIAQVLLVDYGNIVDVSWNDIKQLPEEFCRIETQAIRVKLADIKSINNTWSEDVRNYLIDELINERRIKMVVNSIQPLEVGVFKEVENGEICINAQLVEQKLAQSCGPMSATVFWSCDESENKFDDNLLLTKTLQDREDDLANDVDEDPEAKIGFKESIIVVKYQDPSLIYIKFKSNLEKEELLLKELQIHYNVVRTRRKSWKCNELCVIWDEASSCYRRGSIRRKMPNFNRYIIYLYDELREIELDIASIFVYDQYFQDNYLDFVYKCYLANLRPAGDGKQWTKASIEMLEQIFRYRKDFYVKKIDSKSKSPRIFGCIMWYALTINGTALQPTKKRFISINNLFIQSGLALNIKQIDNINNNKLSLEDAHVVKEQPSTIGECFTKTWPTYLPIKDQEFDAKIICIDTNGIFYIRTDEFDELYKELETKMKEEFDKTDNLVKRTNWTYGEMCTIKYEDYWYRGTISDNNNNSATNQITVEMIDFASEHEIDYNNLCAQIMFPDVAPLLQRIRLFNIYPANGDFWPTTVYEKVYSLVESDIHVIIKSDLKQSLPLAEIYSRSGKNLNQFLVDNCEELIGYNKSLTMDTIDCGDDPEEEEQDFTNDEDNNDNNEIVGNSNTSNNMNWIEDDDVIVEKFYYPPLSTGQMSEMFIVNVLKFNEIVLCYNNKQSDDLKLLTDNIEQTINEQPMLDNPNVDQPCVAFIKSEKTWARAKILNLNSYGFATVFFVDYAIIEMIVTSDIKQIKPEWLDLLVPNYIARINVVLSNTNEENRYFNRLKASIGKSVLVEIINDDPLTVELHPKE